MNDRNLRRSSAFWVEVLNKGILVSGVDNTTVEALCAHLADLGVLEKIGDEWELVSRPEGSSTIEEDLEKSLHDLCATENGFALRYFLDQPPPLPDIPSSKEEGTGTSKDKPKGNPQLLDRKTSNLSNLQIVNKYGRQVQSFLELEKSYTERLVGPHTSLKEARKIFNFILSRMQQKAEPRPWEQLSRRRHK